MSSGDGVDGGDGGDGGDGDGGGGERDMSSLPWPSPASPPPAGRVLLSHWLSYWLRTVPRGPDYLGPFRMP